jgi:hypothetical protein
MEINEKASIRLEIDDEQSSARMAEVKNEVREIGKSLRDLKADGEVGSEAWKELKKQQALLNGELKDLKHNIDVNDASLNDLNGSLRYWQREAQKAKVDSEEWIAASMKVGEIKNRITDVKEEMNELGGVVRKHGDDGGWWSQMKAQALGVFTGMGLLEIVKSAGAALLEFGMDVFNITGKFEKYEAVLKNALGTQEAATAAMADIKKFAAETPFSVDELTESYIKYVNRGLQPTMAEMTKLGDIASSQGKSFEQLTEAVLDATTGEFERLKEFGIQASKSGDQVELSFKGVNQTVSNTPEAIKEALLAFGELEGVQGGMAAISATLEGRVSNLGDAYDTLLLTVGTYLMPVFSFFLDVLSGGIRIINDVLTGNISLSESSEFLGGVMEALGNVFSTIWDVLYSVVEIGIDLFGTFAKIADNAFGLSGNGKILEVVIYALSLSFKVIGTVLIAALAGVQALADGFLVIQNEAKKLMNFMGADFKIDASATFDNLNKNAERNFAKVEELWGKVSESRVEVSAKADDNITKNSGAAGEKQTSNNRKETDKQAAIAKKLADDKEKANETLLKKLEDNEVKAIADDTLRKIAKADLDYKRETAAIKTSLADQKTKDAALIVAETLHTASVAKIQDDARDKKDKADEAQRKKDEAEQKKKEAEEKKYREEKLKAEKQLLDDEFRAAIANAKLDLSLTETNSQAMWDAKRRMLDIELAHKQAKLRQEAADEKARIAESLLDTETKAARTKAVDDRLAAELRTNETQLQADKKKLQADANAVRQKNNEEFYTGLNAAMSGDMNAFLDFLKKKNVSETGNLQKSLQANMQHIQGVGTAMLTGVNTLIKLNADYTERQIGNLTKEKDANFAKLDEEFAKGRITKEELEAAKVSIQGKYDLETLELKKKEFERNKKMQIAQALISGSMAVLSALATPPFPLGLVLAVTAGIKTAIDINKIKKTQFEAADGYISNAGVLQGGRHGSSYGKGGIAMYDRASGEEVGEAEGGEAFMILSRNTTKNNGELIRRLMHSSLNQNGAPITMENGGIVPLREVDSMSSRTYRNGVLKMWREGYIEDRDFDYSTLRGSNASTNAAYAENRAKASDMQNSAKETAINTAEALSKYREMISLLHTLNGKNFGITLHDLNNALDRAVNANSRSDL